MKKNDVMKELVGAIGVAKLDKGNTDVDVFFAVNNKLNELKGVRNIVRSFTEGFFEVWYIPTEDGDLTVYIECVKGTFYCTFTNEFISK
jgi:hypothetical protein